MSDKQEVSDRKYVFTVSAKSVSSLNESIERYAGFVEKHTNTPLSSLSYVMNKGRDRYKVNIAFVAGSIKEFKEKLIMEKDNAKEIKLRKLILLCSGDTPIEAIQYSDELKDKGVIFDGVLGNSRGNVIVSYLSGKLGYNSAIDSFNNYDGDPYKLDIDKFKNALLKMSADADILFMEIGKDSFLMKMVKDILRDSQRYISYEGEDIDEFMCGLYLNGTKINWEAYYDDSEKRRISIPVYPFDRNYCWPKKLRNVCSEHKNTESKNKKKSVMENVKDIWKEVIGTDNIADNDDFYSAGGSSIMHMQIISRVRELMDVELSFEDIEDNDTIYLLTKCIEEKMPKKIECNDDAILRIPRNEKLCLSSTQQSMIYIYENYPDSSAYNMSASFRLNGDISAENIEKSFRKVVSDNEVLRTVYKKIDGEYFQNILDGSSFSMKREILDDYNGDRDRAYESICADSDFIFNLRKEIPIRVHLIEISENEAFLSIQLHHICADSWSATLIIKAFLDNYETLMQGKDLTEKSSDKLDYADYAQWQRNALESNKGREKVDFWKKYLENIQPYLNFPLSRQRTGTAGPAKVKTIDFGAVLSDMIRSYTSELKLSIYEFMLSLYGILLYRYSKQNDFCVGVATANRLRREFEDIIGFFANTLAVRFRIDENVGFSKFALDTKHMLTQLFSNQDIPFEYIVSEINPKRDLLYSPVFQHVFTMRSFESENKSSRYIKMQELENYNSDAKFDFVFILDKSGSSGNISVSVEYDSSLFSGSEIEELLQNYKSAANAVIVSPDKPISLISLTRGNVIEADEICNEDTYDF